MSYLSMTNTAAVQSIHEGETARQPTDSDASAVDGRTNDASAAESLSTDDLFHLLQNSRRRAVLRYLRGREGPARMRDVAEQVAAWENDTTVAQLASDERQRVYISLYQSHLETLEDAGVIDYNKPRGVIEPRPLLDHVAAYVDTDRSDATDDGEASDGDPKADAWSQRYIGASIVSGVLFVGVALGLLTGFTAGVLVLLLFTGMTLAKLTLDSSGAA